MELSTLIGIVFGFACVVLSIFFAGGTIMAFLDPASVFIVVGGLIAALMIAYPLDKLMLLTKLMGKAFKKNTVDFSEAVEQILRLSQVARREGVIALENQLSDVNDPFLKKGVMLIVDAVDEELLRGVLETDLDNAIDRHTSGQSILNTASSLAPAYGMIGTLIGLIIMLGKLDDPSALGPGMATALITTFYGCILANMIFTPMSKKLGQQADDEHLRKSMLIEGLLSIQSGENPRMTKEKLEAFLNASQRASGGKKAAPAPAAASGGDSE